MPETVGKDSTYGSDEERPERGRGDNGKNQRGDNHENDKRGSSTEKQTKHGDDSSASHQAWKHGPRPTIKFVDDTRRLTKLPLSVWDEYEGSKGEIEGLPQASPPTQCTRSLIAEF